MPLPAKKVVCKNNLTALSHVSKNLELTYLKQRNNSFLRNNTSEFVVKLQKKKILYLTQTPDYFKHKNLFVLEIVDSSPL